MHHVGDIIDDRYQLTRPLGVRHGAEMWEGEHRLAGRKVTLKILRPEPGNEHLAREALTLEARAASEIAHPSLVEVYDVGVTSDGRAYLVTELLRGETLADIVVRHGAMQPEDACQVMLQLLAGLEAAHGVNAVHGDLRADDIVLRKGRDGRLVVKLLDFGRPPSVRPESMPPVSAAKPTARNPDVHVDIQAVGAILYEMLTGRAATRQDVRAQTGSVPEVAQSLVPAIPAGLARVVDQALASAPGRGIESAKEMAGLLASFAISERPPSLAPRDTLMPFLSQEARRSRGMARLERAVLGIGDARPSARPNLVLIEGAQDKPQDKPKRPTDRPSKAPPSGEPLGVEDLIEPRIPKPPRTPKHIGGSVPRLLISERYDSVPHRRRSSIPLRRWKAARGKGSAKERGKPKSGMSPVAVRIWSAGLLAAAGLSAGLLLARLLHF